MQSPSQPVTVSSIPEPSGFAGFLAALASPAPGSPKTQWNDNALADDVATLSYESALKAHARYKPAAEPLAEPSSAFAAEHVNTTPVSSFSIAASEPLSSATGAGEHKSASITIRMSQAECSQLKQRAAEAGMTISAYLRSCTFEAEALRGQVKKALAQLRAAATSNDKKPAAPLEQRKRFDWLSRILPRGGVRNSSEVN